MAGVSTYHIAKNCQYLNLNRAHDLQKNLLDLTDLFLNFASYLFTGAFSFQFWIIGYPSLLRCG